MWIFRILLFSRYQLWHYATVMASSSPQVRIDLALSKQLDAWIGRQLVPPARNAVVETALRQFLAGESSSPDVNINKVLESLPQQNDAVERWEKLPEKERQRIRKLCTLPKYLETDPELRDIKNNVAEVMYAKIWQENDYNI